MIIATQKKEQKKGMIIGINNDGKQCYKYRLYFK